MTITVTVAEDWVTRARTIPAAKPSAVHRAEKAKNSPTHSDVRISWDP